MTVLNVFVDSKEQFGNPVGIVNDINNEIHNSKRQEIATNSGFSEVVFVNSLNKPSISIYSPQNEIAFAGHAALGALKYITDQTGRNISTIFCFGHEIICKTDSQMYWINANVKTFPPWNLLELPSPDKVDSLDRPEILNFLHTFVWSWIEKNKNIIRARTFAPDWDIPEDEANGSGSMLLALSLQKELTIKHGKGSIIHVKPIDYTTATVGGNIIYA